MAVVPFFTPTQQDSRLRFKNLLLATDLTEASTEAETYALRLAQSLGSHLLVLHVEPASAHRSTALESTEPNNLKQKIASLDEFFRTSGVPFNLRTERGEVHSVLTKVAGQHSIDLIILGSHGRQGVSYLFMGSMSEDVTRSAACPVITVGPHARAGLENLVSTIVYATDFSEESKLALPYATSLAQEFQASLTVCHVAPKAGRLVTGHEQVEAYLFSRLKSLAPKSQFPWCTVNYVVAFGDPAAEILNIAKEGRGDLIVLGLHTSVRYTSHLPERLSYKILCEARSPVLSILPGSRETKLAKLPADYGGAIHVC